MAAKSIAQVGDRIDRHATDLGLRPGHILKFDSRKKYVTVTEVREYGVVILDDGYILTNALVDRGPAEVVGIASRFLPSQDEPTERIRISSVTPETDEAIERVAEYVRQFGRLNDTGGTIHSVHTDPDVEGATLTLKDLQTVLDALLPTKP